MDCFKNNGFKNEGFEEEIFLDRIDTVFLRHGLTRILFGHEKGQKNGQKSTFFWPSFIILKSELYPV